MITSLISKESLHTSPNVVTVFTPSMPPTTPDLFYYTRSRDYLPSSHTTWRQRTPSPKTLFQRLSMASHTARTTREHQMRRNEHRVNLPTSSPSSPIVHTHTHSRPNGHVSDASTIDNTVGRVHLRPAGACFTHAAQHAHTSHLISCHHSIYRSTLSHLY